MKRPLLEIKDLSITFNTSEGNIHAVQNLSLTIHPGEIVGLIGESGSGKSATATAIMRLLDPSHSEVAGRILFQGHDLALLSEEEMCPLRGSKISMIFQDPMTALNPTWKIGSQISEALRIHQKISKKQALEKSASLLEQVGIPDAVRRLDQYPHELSGGLRQRVLIAIALANAPDLIIADELTTALDTTTKKQLKELLFELQKSFSCAFLIISHDLAFVADLCEKICVMYSGTLVETAPAPMLFERPQHPYTQGLLESLPAYARSKKRPLKAIPGTIEQPYVQHTCCPFYKRCPFAMKICKKQKPRLEAVGEEHTAACFLHHPQAKKPLQRFEKKQKKSVLV